jgi:hypothetical protein
VFQNGYSGQVIFESWTLSFYNVFFTFLPPFAMGVFDQFISARLLDRYPQLYQLGQKGEFVLPPTIMINVYSSTSERSGPGLRMDSIILLLLISFRYTSSLMTASSQMVSFQVIGCGALPFTPLCC